MTRPITAGLDGSEESLAALAWAAREAVRRDAPLHAVHAWRFQDRGVAGTVTRETQEGWARDALASAVGTVAERHPGLTVTTDLREGDAVAALLAAAGEAETLVLGSRGHGPVVGFLLGSVGRQVIAEAPGPVVLVRAGDEASSEAAGREVVVGQQGEPEDSADVIGFAFEAAAARGATVRAVRAWALPTVFTYSPGSMALADEAGAGAVRAQGARRGARTVARALPRRPGGRARGDGQRRPGAAVGVRGRPADGRRPPRPAQRRRGPDRLGGARRAPPRRVPGGGGPAPVRTRRGTPFSPPWAEASPAPWAGC